MPFQHRYDHHLLNHTSQSCLHCQQPFDLFCHLFKKQQQQNTPTKAYNSCISPQRSHVPPNQHMLANTAMYCSHKSEQCAHNHVLMSCLQLPAPSRNNLSSFLSGIHELPTYDATQHRTYGIQSLHQFTSTPNFPPADNVARNSQLSPTQISSSHPHPHTQVVPWHKMTHRPPT